MKALIIGGAGFVGAYLMRYLKEELHMEVTVTKMPQEQIEAENVKVCDLDILKKDDITGLFKAEQPDWIFHLAAQSSVSVSWKNPALTIDVNVKGGSNVLEAFRESGIKARMLLIGSGEEYGHILPQETPQQTGQHLCGNESMPEYAWKNLCRCLRIRCHDGTGVQSYRTEPDTDVCCGRFLSAGSRD